MNRSLKILAFVITLVVVGWAYLSIAKKIDPRPAPQELMALEDTLAGPDLVGLFYVDMEYMLRLEEAIGGEGDPFALPTPTLDKDDAVSDSFLDFLRESGLRVDESVEYILGGFIAREKSAGKVQVALGNFPVHTLTKNWKQNKNVKQTENNGRIAWIWTPIDAET